MSGYPGFRKSRTTLGIGESPASQRLTVRSSLKSISTAKRRALKPDASIAERRRSAPVAIVGKNVAVRALQCPHAGAVMRDLAALPANFIVHPARSVLAVDQVALNSGLDSVRAPEASSAAQVYSLPGVFHNRLRFHAGLNCPDPREYRAYVLTVKGQK